MPQILKQRFGRLIVNEAVRKPGKWYFKCACDCGTETVVRFDHLTSGRSTSCGCYAREVTAKQNLRHGDCRRTTGGHAPEFAAWSKMNERCRNPRDKSFHRYGGRGIRVCDEWKQSYVAFLAHVGRRPSPKHSLDRINNDGNYEPGNVRWATKIDQCNNRRTNRFLEFSGIRQTLAQWGRELGIDQMTLRARLVNGWSVEKTLTTPLQ